MERFCCGFNRGISAYSTIHGLCTACRLAGLLRFVCLIFTGNSGITIWFIKAITNRPCCCSFFNDGSGLGAFSLCEPRRLFGLCGRVSHYCWFISNVTRTVAPRCTGRIFITSGNYWIYQCGCHHYWCITAI